MLAFRYPTGAPVAGLALSPGGARMLSQEPREHTDVAVEGSMKRSDFKAQAIKGKTRYLLAAMEFKQRLIAQRRKAMASQRKGQRRPSRFL